MSLSKKTLDSIKNSSWIRKMFEEGERLKKEHGENKVFDLSLGNPVFEPAVKVKETIKELLSDNYRGFHRYMPNAGFPETRSYIAEKLNRESQSNLSFQDIIMTVGAGGALNIVIKTLCNPGDEIITLTPYFPEYNAYANNFDARLVPVHTNDQFKFDFQLLEKAINAKTRIVLINSPNNPSGVVYPKKAIQKLSELLAKKSNTFKKTITFLSDEPYKYITYDGISVPNIMDFYEESIIVNSFSKDLAVPGERIGYIAISEKSKERELMQQGMVISLRTLGFVNAPALMQRVLPLVDGFKVDMKDYIQNRKILYNHLLECGFDCVRPQGAFYLFPKSPIANDIEFVQELAKMLLLVSPGTGFGRPGYFRVAYSFKTDFIKRVLPIFSKAAKKFDLI